MTTEQRNKALFETFKGMSARHHGMNGVVCGYDPREKIDGVLIMALSEPYDGAWSESSLCDPIIESHKNNEHGYLWISKDDITVTE